MTYGMSVSQYIEMYIVMHINGHSKHSISILNGKDLTLDNQIEEIVPRNRTVEEIHH